MFAVDQTESEIRKKLTISTKAIRHTNSEIISIDVK